MSDNAKGALLWEPKTLPRWDSTNPDWQWLRQRHGTKLPSVLTEHHPDDDAIVAPRLQWRTAIYHHLYTVAHEPQSFWLKRDRYEIADAIEAIFQLAPKHGNRLRDAVVGFFHRIVSSGILDQLDVAEPSPPPGDTALQRRSDT